MCKISSVQAGPTSRLGGSGKLSGPVSLSQELLYIHHCALRGQKIWVFLLCACNALRRPEFLRRSLRPGGSLAPPAGIGQILFLCATKMYSDVLCESVLICTIYLLNSHESKKLWIFLYPLYNTIPILTFLIFLQSWWWWWWVGKGISASFLHVQEQRNQKKPRSYAADNVDTASTCAKQIQKCPWLFAGGAWGRDKSPEWKQEKLFSN
jgi:hypothetical protein